MKIIRPTLHGIIDYLVVVALLLLPSFLGFSDFVAQLTYTIAGVHFLLTILTAFPPGIFRRIPLRLHGLIELALAILILFLPWIFDFNEAPLESNFYLIFGGSVLLIWILTDYNLPRRPKAR